ncbi:MAG: hypothetical protein ACXWUR_07570 [Allosphingosinicella sp.]
MRIAYLVGADAHQAIERHGLDIGSSGSTDLHRLRTRGPRDYARLHVTRNYFRQPLRYDLDEYDLLLNLVTDPDQNPEVLGVLAKLVKTCRGRVLNAPKAVLRSTRDRVARACAAVPNLIVPRTLRLSPGRPESVLRQVEAAGLAFPAILRLTGTHTGRILGRVGEAGALAPLLVPGQAHYLTEFVDFRGADGLYRKWRFFFIGGETVMRHLLVSDQWNVHAADRQRFMAPRPNLVRDEREAIEAGLNALPAGVRAGLGGIGAAAGLDFFGLDCAVAQDGRLILFEANATMNFFPLAEDPRFAYLATAFARAQRAFDAMLFGGAA